jgi:hypothetical protein
MGGGESKIPASAHRHRSSGTLPISRAVSCALSLNDLSALSQRPTLLLEIVPDFGSSCRSSFSKRRYCV